MKKIVIFILTVMALFSFAACSNGAPPTTNTPTITVNQAVITLKPYETFDLIVSYDGQETITFTSSNQSVVTVDDNGVISAIAIGDATITVAAGEVKKVCYVYVTENNELPVLTVTNADQGEIKVNVNNTYTILTKTTFNNQTIDAVLSFSSTDEQIVSVDNNGKITANKVGEAIIEITGSWREFVGGEIFTSVKVIVKDDVSFDLVAQEKDLFAMASLDGTNYKNTTSVIPSLTVNGQKIESGFTYESSDLSILSVNDSGLVTAKKSGTATITCRYNHSEIGEIYATTDIFVGYAVKEKTLLEEFILELGVSPSADQLKEIFSHDLSVTKIVDITDKEKQVAIDQDGKVDSSENVIRGERKWRIYNDAYAYEVDILVVDNVISTKDDLNNILKLGGNKYFILGADISNVGDYSGWYSFSGTLDGKGHTISGINIQSRGLFGLLTGGAVIKNIAVSQATLTGTSGVFGVQCDGVTFDNVSVWITGANCTDETPVGGLVFQIGGGMLNINNTVVYAENVKDKNFGAITGCWWGSGYNITNSYFITDGTPCGIAFKSGSSAHNNEFGLVENAKGSWEHFYSSNAKFVEEMNKTDSNIVLKGFDQEIWNFSSSRIPIFKTDVGLKSVFTTEVKGEKTNGELFFFSKNVTKPTGYAAAYVDNGNYKITLPTAITGNQVLNVNIGANVIDGYSFNATTRTLKIPVSEVTGIVTGQTNVMVETDMGAFKFKVTIADYVLKTAADVMSVLPKLNEDIPAGSVSYSGYIVLDGDIEFAATDKYNKGSFDFRGTLDGRGYAIKNLNFGTKVAGLFNTMNAGCLVKNIAMINVTFGSDWRGGVFAFETAHVHFENVFVSTTNYAGPSGLVSSLAGNNKIYDVIVSYTVSATGDGGSIAASYTNSATIDFDDVYTITIRNVIGTENTNNKSVDYAEINKSACANTLEVKEKSQNLKGFDSNYWSIDNSGNVLFGDEIVLAVNN